MLDLYRPAVLRAGYTPISKRYGYQDTLRARRCALMKAEEEARKQEEEEEYSDAPEYYNDGTIIPF